jgi:8-oxo-dGTP pyrophosphatase MutT (NUDIX family)
VGEKKKKKTPNRFITSSEKITDSDSDMVAIPSISKTSLKPISREFSAGGVVYKKDKTKTLWLVTKSASSKMYPDTVWRLPKGWLDDIDNGTKPGPYTLGLKKASEELLQKAAVREVEEEGGIYGKIINKITTDKYFFTKKDGERVLKFITFYLMEWQFDLTEGFGSETSEIGWSFYEEARKKLKHQGEKKILDKAKEALTQGIQKI